jgi:hypothetical protein
MRINHTTANEVIRCLWTSPGTVALARVSARHRPSLANLARTLHLNAAVDHNAADSLRNPGFPRLQKLVKSDVLSDIELALNGVASLAELCILSRDALGLMLADAAPLSGVHLCHAIAADNLGVPLLA